MSVRRTTRRRVRILDESNSDAASGLRSSVDEGLPRMSMPTGSGEERSIMAYDQDMEGSRVMDDQSSRRPSAADRQ